MCVSFDETEPVDCVLTFSYGYNTLEYSWMKVTVVFMCLQILFMTLQNTNSLPSAITWDELNNLAPSDCVKKRQQSENWYISCAHGGSDPHMFNLMEITVFNSVV